MNASLSAAGHLRLLHPPARHGKVTIAHGHGEQWRERALLPDQAIEMADGLDGQRDVYVSSQSFRGYRANSRVAQLGAFYADLDYHTQAKWRALPPEAVAHAVLLRLKDDALPEPSVILFTGRGLLVLWLHDLVPGRAAPRWQEIETRLVDALADFGADRAAVDPARVFRVCGTVNSKSGETVRALFVSEQCRAGLRWDFEALAAEMLPDARPGSLEGRTERATRAARRARSRGRRTGAATYTRRTYHMAVLTDLIRLLDHRGGVLPPGGRDQWMFLAACAMAWLYPAGVLADEVERLARERADWSATECRQRLGAVLHRAMLAAALVNKAGKPAPGDPRYRFAARTMISRLGIAEAEMWAADLRVLVNQRVKRRHSTQRQMARRRRRGQVERMAYLDPWHRQREHARDLRAAGRPWAEVAALAGYPSASAARMAVTRNRHRTQSEQVRHGIWWRSPVTVPTDAGQRANDCQVSATPAPAAAVSTTSAARPATGPSARRGRPTCSPLCHHPSDHALAGAVAPHGARQHASPFEALLTPRSLRWLSVPPAPPMKCMEPSTDGWIRTGCPSVPGPFGRSVVQRVACAAPLRPVDHPR